MLEIIKHDRYASYIFNELNSKLSYSSGSQYWESCMSKTRSSSYFRLILYRSNMTIGSCSLFKQGSDHFHV